MIERPRGEPEPTPPQEIHLTREHAYTIGRGLEQLLEDPFNTMGQALLAIEQPTMTGTVLSGVERIRAFTRKFQTAREVTLAPHNPGWQIIFSDEDEDQPIPSTTQDLPIDLVDPLTSALRHHINNPRSLFAMADIIDEDFPSVESKILLMQIQRIGQVLDPVLNAPRLHIEADGQGTARITPLERATS